MPLDSLAQTKMQPEQAGAVTPPSKRASRRRLLRPVLGILAAVVAVVVGAWWLGEGRYIISTDNAYVQGDIAVLGPRVDGDVAAIHVSDNQAVRAGDALISLDPTDWQAKLDQSRAAAGEAAAAVATARRQVEQSRAAIAQSEAMIAQAEAEVTRAVAEAGRANTLAGAGWTSRQANETAVADRRKAEAQLAAMRAARATAGAALAVAEAQVAGFEAHRQAADAAVRLAASNLAYTVIRAPFDGIVGNRAAQLGQHVQTGQQLIALAPPAARLYVVANFKETQLGQMRPGQKVRLVPDIDGPTIRGRVESLAPATGALFSLLPPENATGNFTKVVQRVPVRIALDPADAAAAGWLRAGLSVTAEIDTRGPDAERHGLFGAAAATLPPALSQTMASPGASAQPANIRMTWREWAGFMAMVVGMFMAILDIQIVSASIAEIQAGLSADPDEAAWVQTSYLIAEIVMIPLSGWLSRLLSTRVLFTISAVGFTVFSAACAMADTLGAMVTFRALQGFIGGAMIPTVFATSFLLFPGPRRAQISVLIGLTATLAPTIGPTLGGWLTNEFSWHWLFLINVPVGAAVAATVWTCLDIDKPDRSLLRRFDMPGLLLMAAFLGSLEYVLEEGSRNDWFEDTTILALSLIALVGGAVFLHRMLTRPDPLVDLKAFRNANFAFGCVFSLILGVGLYGSVYIIPIFLGRVRGYDSLQIGETMFVTGLCMFASAPVAGRLAPKVDMRRMLAVGLAMFGTSVWWLAHLTSQSAFWEMLLPQCLRGFSMMFIMLPVNQLALGTLPPASIKNAAGLYNLMRNLGGAIGLALINTIATARAAVHTLHLDEQVTWARPGAVRVVDEMTQAMGQRGSTAHLAALKRVAMMVQREALTLTYNDVLLLMALTFAVAVPLTLLLAKPRAVAGGAH